MSQVHKEQLTAIENALPNRAGLDVEIFGMEGVPEDVIQAHNQRVLTQFQQAEAERRAATGNPAPGGSSGNQPKKPRLESPADLKKRLAEHKAKLAERAAGGSSGDATPVGAGQSMQTPTGYVCTLSSDALPWIDANRRCAGSTYPIRGGPAAFQQRCSCCSQPTIFIPAALWRRGQFSLPGSCCKSCVPELLA